MDNREFQVGDRVKLWGFDFDWLGVVVEVGHSRANVLFDGKESLTYWPLIRSLELIEPAKKKIEPLPLP